MLIAVSGIMLRDVDKIMLVGVRSTILTAVGDIM